jgi:uncharacterized membrane protein YdjX (TVP38/TMEM64 family)
MLPLPSDEMSGEPALLSTAASTEGTTTTTATIPWWERRPVRWIVLLIVVTAIVWVAKDLSAGDNSLIVKANASFVVWLESHPGLGVLAVIAVYIVATVCFVPGSLLTIGTSFAFGKAFQSTTNATLLSSFAVFVGASLGSISCFLLGRYLFREPVERMAQNYPIILAFDRAMLHNGFYIMLMLRLSPLVPYNALDYLSGITSISLMDYTLAMIGLLPGTVVFCFIGATASDLTEGKLGDSQTIVAIVVGLVFAAASVGLASYYSKIELEKLLEERDQHQRLEYDSLPREDRNDDGIEATFEAA